MGENLIKSLLLLAVHWLLLFIWVRLNALLKIRRVSISELGLLIHWLIVQIFLISLIESVENIGISMIAPSSSMTLFSWIILARYILSSPIIVEWACLFCLSTKSATFHCLLGLSFFNFQLGSQKTRINGPHNLNEKLRIFEQIVAQSYCLLVAYADYSYIIDQCLLILFKSSCRIPLRLCGLLGAIIVIWRAEVTLTGVIWYEGRFCKPKLIVLNFFVPFLCRGIMMKACTLCLVETVSVL